MLRWHIFIEGFENGGPSYATSCFTKEGEEILRVGGFGSEYSASQFIVAYIVALTNKGAHERQQAILAALSLATPTKPEGQ